MVYSLPFTLSDYKGECKDFACGRVTFCADRKLPKSCLGEGGFRFPPSPRYPIPLKRPTSSSRTSYPSPRPKGQGSLIPSLVLSQWNPLRWASIGSPLRPPIGCIPRGLAVTCKLPRRNGPVADGTADGCGPGTGMCSRQACISGTSHGGGASTELLRDGRALGAMSLSEHKPI